MRLLLLCFIFINQEELNFIYLYLFIHLLIPYIILSGYISDYTLRIESHFPIGVAMEL